MSFAKPDPNAAVSEEILRALGDLTGPQPGFRPVHAKGILLTGRFTPAPSAVSLTRAPHTQRNSTPVTVRFSDFAGIPAIPDNHPDASPRGIAIRFHLAEHVHTDIIGHSVDGFPVRTAEEFAQFLRAVYASGADAARPTPIEKFLATHPAALAFVQTPKPVPASFASESLYGVSACRFITKDGVARYGRYRIRPENGNRFLDAEAAAKESPNFLSDEIKERLAGGSAAMGIAVQIAADGDLVTDATMHWPGNRTEIGFGTIELTGVLPNNAAEQQHIIFDPVPRVDGIEASDDPLFDVRASTYLMSGRRRRADALVTGAGG